MPSESASPSPDSVRGALAKPSGWHKKLKEFRRRTGESDPEMLADLKDRLKDNPDWDIHDMMRHYNNALGLGDVEDMPEQMQMAEMGDTGMPSGHDIVRIFGQFRGAPVAMADAPTTTTTSTTAAPTTTTTLPTPPVRVEQRGKTRIATNIPAGRR